MKSKPELLAPAGDYACFQAALRAGADAVYIGGQKYGARAYAGNFSDQEVITALKEAHFYGRRLYLTVNTLMKQEELDGLEEFILPFYEEGLDGVIVQDVGAMAVLKRCFPGLPLHASTQMTITDADGAEALRELGIVRVVPARELSLSEVSALRRESGLEVETFIHGAMCYCYSGQCLFSSMLGGRSGNRGRCAQPCRQPYRIQEGKTGKECYPLSLKDMCTIQFLPKLMEAGIDSFKIEGRMKKPEYVAGVTSVYRRRIDECLAAGGDVPVREEDVRLLSSLYIRSGISGGYYHKHNGREMITLDQPGYAGCGEEVLARIRAEIIEPELTLPVCMRAVLQEGKPFTLQAWEEGKRPVCLTGGMVQKAQKRPLAETEVERQLRKTGGSGFRVEKLELEMEEDVFLPVRELNELRRAALEELKERRISEHMPYEPQMAVPDGKDGQEKGVWNCGADAREAFASDEAACQGPAAAKQAFHASVSTLEQLESCLAAGVDRIYINASQADADWLARLGKNAAAEIFLTLPIIWRRETGKWQEELWKLVGSGLFAGVQIASPSALTWLRDHGFSGKVAFDHRLYIWNRETYAYWKPYLDTYCAPLELNRRDIYALPKQGREILVYGRVPMMVSANCIRKTNGHCLKEGRTAEGEAALVDRYQTRFPVRTDCRSCYNVIYNSVPLSLHGYLEELRRRESALRLDFLEEDGEETANILHLFMENPGNVARVSYPYTTGHFKKGAQ